MEPRHCERSEAIQGRHTHSLDRFVASLLAMTPYHQVLILSASTRCQRKMTHGASSLRAKRSNPGTTHALSGSLRRFAPRDDAVSPSFDSVHWYSLSEKDDPWS